MTDLSKFAPILNSALASAGIKWKLVEENAVVNPPQPTPSAQPNLTTPKTPSKYSDVLSRSLYGMTWQTSGKKPSWNANPHREDCFMSDGQDVGKDLSGGFHDAGDYIKVALASATGACQVAMSMMFYLNSYSNADKIIGLGILTQYCDWFLKCMESDNTGIRKFYHWVADSDIDHKDMRPAHLQDGKNRRSFAIGDGAEPFGDEPLGCTAAALALSSQVFKKEGNVEYGLKLEKAAISLYEFMKKRKGKYTAHTVYASSSRGDEMVLAGACLFGVTKNTVYLSEAEGWVKEFNVYPGYAYMADNQSILAIYLLAFFSQKQLWIDMCKNVVSSWLEGKAGVRKHPNNPLRSSSDWGTIPQCGAVWACLKFGHDYIPGLKNDLVVSEGKKILDYCTGENPKSFSWLVGYGSNYPKHIHHRETIGQGSGQSDLEGIGLWVAGEKLDGFYQDVVTDWITNEAGSYNTAMIFFVSTLA